MKYEKTAAAGLILLLLMATATAATPHLVMGRDYGGAAYWYEAQSSIGTPAEISFGNMARADNVAFSGSVGTKVRDSFGNVYYGTGFGKRPVKA